MTRILAVAIVAAAASSFAASPTVAQPKPYEPDLRSLGLGLAAVDLPRQGYAEFACGSNGGPPLKKLNGWIDFRACLPDKLGLREVYVEYDNEGDAVAKVYQDGGQATWLDKYSGTKVAGRAVILSLLFDAGGTVRGLRVVTDSRAPLEERGKAYLLRVQILGHYGREGWDCIDRPPANGQTPVGQTFINQLCRKAYNGDRVVTVETHFFRKAGQTGVDAQGQWQPGDFESSTRWEVWDPSLPAL